MRRYVWIALVVLTLASCGHRQGTSHRVIVLGVDGMDPGFIERHQNALPNIAALRRTGDFRRLATTIPPQSPVAWATFITGRDPGGHGVFDFVHRNPSTMQPFSSMAEVEESSKYLPIGPYRLPLSSGRVRLLHQGTAFWQLLGERGIPAAVIRIPNNLPPVPGNSRSLAGMGVPDLQGTFGTFTFFTDDALELSHEVPGGRIVKVRGSDGRFVLPVGGPANSLRKDRAPTSVDLIADVDPQAPAARFRLADSVCILNEHEWSGWIRADFPLIPGLKFAHGMFRIYVKQLHPVLQVYVSPVNLDPASPDLPISIPASYSREIARAIGPFYTQGIAEDTAVYRAGYFDLEEYLAQSRLVADEQAAMLRHTLGEFRTGLLFFYISALDQDSHMLWGKHEKKLVESYRFVDRIVGEIVAHANGATVIVMSDHGFARFDRAFNLNTWLRKEGFLYLDNPAPRAGGEGFSHVDWRRTRAYAMGLNGLYVNLSGREKEGIVLEGPERARLLSQISARLLDLCDPLDGRRVVDAVYQPRQVFHGGALQYAPDLIVGYAEGFRSSWQTALGASPENVLEDNRDAWIGDHCIDPRHVPGTLLVNRPVRLSDPKLADVTVTILREFGMAAPQEMQGRPLF